MRPAGRRQNRQYRRLGRNSPLQQLPALHRLQERAHRTDTRAGQSAGAEVQVNCVAVGPVMPPEGSSEEEIARMLAGTLTKRLGSPEDVARAVMFLCEGTDFATGTTLLLDGGRLLN